MKHTPTTEIYMAPGADEVFEMAARRLVAAVGESLGVRPVSAVCLAGGSTPKGLYRLLSTPDFIHRLAWERVHFFWGDERCVPPDHDDSNYRMAQEALLSHLPLSPAQVHRIPGEIDPARAAGIYEAELKLFLPRAGESEPGVFDVVLLGLGADGHTASLFPYHRALTVRKKWVVPVDRPGELPRVTLTLPVLNAARQVHFLVMGEEKAQAVHKVIEGSVEPEAWPAKMVRPATGRVLWFLDPPAASLLESIRPRLAMPGPDDHDS